MASMRSAAVTHRVASAIVGAMGWGDMALSTSARIAAARNMAAANSELGANYTMVHLGNSRLLGAQLREAQRRLGGALAAAEENFGTESSLRGIAGCVLETT